ncbi:hypothetical protein ACFSTD_19760 [Novosphingobium colocasiae]
MTEWLSTAARSFFGLGAGHHLHDRAVVKGVSDQQTAHRIDGNAAEVHAAADAGIDQRFVEARRGHLAVIAQLLEPHPAPQLIERGKPPHIAASVRSGPAIEWTAE